MVSLKKASIFLTFVEAMFYGFFVLMLILTMWILLGHRHRRRPNYVFSFLTWFQEMTINIIRIYQAFVTVGPHVYGGPEACFEELSHATFLVKSCLCCTQTLIIDGVVIYRAYVVWKNIHVVVLPALAWCGLLALEPTSRSYSKQACPSNPQVVPWITAIYAHDLSTNFLSTGQPAARCLSLVALLTSPQHSSRTASGASSARPPGIGESETGLAPILCVVMESGAIYSATIGAGMLLFLVHSNAVFILMDRTSPIISIVFNMIVVRVGLAQERRANRSSTRAQQTGSGLEFRRGRNRSARPITQLARRTPFSIELDDVTVKITQLLHALEGPSADEVNGRPDVKAVGLVPDAAQCGMICLY
ncbi:hypothetical protein C8T65DRAFT_741524 [Cerioporus squamosus]|nr:hypothetical protein C8T65DRAFT_741524 [Cerioporus squamosus]